jgi:hypothetical protein
VPNPYSCQDTGSSLTISTLYLKAMLDAYHRSHPDTQLELIGHSLGGYLALEVTQFVGHDPDLPLGSIGKVATFDSPLNHLSQQNNTNEKHLVPLSDHLPCSLGWVQTYSVAASQLSDVTDANRQSIRNAQAAFVTAGRAENIAYMTVGNAQDCAWYLTLCNVPPTKQWLDDEPTMTISTANLQKMYPLGVGGCGASHPSVLNLACVSVSHGLTLEDGFLNPHSGSAISDVVSFMG